MKVTHGEYAKLMRPWPVTEVTVEDHLRLQIVTKNGVDMVLIPRRFD